MPKYTDDPNEPRMTKEEQANATTYEYAGFQYRILRNDIGEAIDMRPQPGQHRAANHDKNRRNALQCFNDGLRSLNEPAR